MDTKDLVFKFNRRLAGWQDFGCYDYITLKGVDYFADLYWVDTISLKDIEGNNINAEGVVKMTSNEGCEIYRTIYYSFEYDEETDDFILIQTSILEKSKEEIFNSEYAGIKNINLKLDKTYGFYTMYIDIPEQKIDEWTKELIVDCDAVITTEKPITNLPNGWYPIHHQNIILIFRWDKSKDKFEITHYIYKGRKKIYKKHK